MCDFEFLITYTLKYVSKNKTGVVDVCTPAV